MAVLHAAHFDASGESTGVPVLAIGGAVAPIKKWNRFEREWAAILKREKVTEIPRYRFRGQLFMFNIEIDAWETPMLRQRSSILIP
jgi:hypothetical protein